MKMSVYVKCLPFEIAADTVMVVVDSFNHFSDMDLGADDFNIAHRLNHEQT